MDRNNVETSIDKNRIIYVKLLKIRKKYKSTISQIKVDLYEKKYSNASENIKICMRYLQIVISLLNMSKLNDWFILRYKTILMDMCGMITRLFVKSYTFKIYECVDLILDGIFDINDANNLKSLMTQTIYFRFRLMNLSIIVSEIYDSERFNQEISKLKIKKMNNMISNNFHKIK